MTDKRFVYNEDLLASCASSDTVRLVLSQHASPDDASGIPNACWTLLEQHAQHYGRPLTDQNAKSRIRRFLESVLLVHDHNQRSLLHKTGLNQFADRNDPLAPPSEEEWLQLWKDEDWETQTMGEVSLIRLHDHESIQNASFHLHAHARRLRTTKRHPMKTFVSPYDTYYPSLKIAQDNDFRETNIATDTKHSHKDAYDDTFQTHLNWATDQNPDGVPVVHPVHDQGACGSCWAYAATGTLEASASRRIAFQAYMEVIQNTLDTLHDSSKDTFVRNDRAVRLAQMAERQAIAVADLSVQELVDCDTWADQGCTGGNPLLAFYFIHRFGLTSTSSYPYVGQQQECQVDRVANPIASVQSWGILTSNHEDNMELVLQNIGPIAVGVNGADQTFLAYTGGIFDSVNCDQVANHALLIVGYGQETDSKGRTIKYWIARNSWGEGWGEDGYVRVKRGQGAKGDEGVCGIARSPSVALGGVLLPESGITTTGIDNGVNSLERMETNLIYNNCATVGLGNVRICHQIEGFLESHPAIFYFLISFVVVGILVVWPLTKECRDRRRQMRSLRPYDTYRKRALERENPNSGESSSLLSLEQHPNTYGLCV